MKAMKKTPASAIRIVATLSSKVLSTRITRLSTCDEA
jgi:hypothetical protein